MTVVDPTPGELPGGIEEVETCRLMRDGVSPAFKSFGGYKTPKGGGNCTDA